MTAPPPERSEGERIKQYKIIVLGSQSVGKTSVIFRFVHGQPVSQTPDDPTGDPTLRKLCNIDEIRCLLQVDDSFGSDTANFSAFRDLEIKNADAAVIMYSVTGRGSFNDIGGIREEISRVRKLKGQDSTPPMVLVGNKIDARQEEDHYKSRLKAEEPRDWLGHKGAGTPDQTSCSPITYQEGEEVARQWGCPFVEVSAKDGTDIEKAFFEVVREIRRKERESEQKVWDEASEKKQSKRSMVDYLRFGQGKLKDRLGPAPKNKIAEALENKRSSNQ